MQALSWYIKRVKTMSGKEITWRVTSLSSALYEHLRVSMNLVSQAEFHDNYQENTQFTPPFNVFIGDISAFCPEWRQALLNKADKIIQHKLSYFDLQEQHLETPINWHKDHATGQQTSRAAIMSVNYRDISKNGDCKLVWEPNRHHQFVVLARAYKITGEIKYAQSVVTQLTSWLDANPYGYGMNWKSPLELGIRMINWVWAIDLILDSGLFAGNFKTQVLNSVYLHCRDVSSKFSQGSSANNHLVGEAAGVYIASSYFSMLKNANHWRHKSKHVLETEIQAQTFADGCSKEHGFSYQFFVFQLYLFSSQVGYWQKDNFSSVYQDTLNKLAAFIALIAQGGENYPMVGDQDDGYALDLGNHVHDINALCDLAAHLYDNQIFRINYRNPCESAFWLFNQRIEREHKVLQEVPDLISRKFPESSYFLLQTGSVNNNDQVSILFDCAELGYTSIAAHGHADALSLVMRLNGKDLFVDTGTYDYYSFPRWRNQFRKTQAHNTLEIDGLDQSVMTGPFMWEQHAQAQCTLWNPTKSGGQVAGFHNGYQRLSSPLIHERHLDLNTQRNRLAITDKIQSQGNHNIALYFHLSENCSNIKIKGNICTLYLNSNKVRISLPKNLTHEIVSGKWHEDTDHTSLGWISRSYHQRTAINTLISKGNTIGNKQFMTIVTWI
ncbi:Heparinase II/III family protein [Moritella viscosa]|uniref:alginate lyase family protein n=1 Tax=Moritella viscosa TaxID=80854 RepID=UPI0009178543|nr:alginate lyase family protein [Moritella viscosa]SGY90629.1 Heparinase II/III family protein [Moritella viscosa]